ncbi:hypothetical protein P3D00_08035, partial [Pseudomonas aeruginosa]
LDVSFGLAMGQLLISWFVVSGLRVLVALEARVFFALEITGQCRSVLSLRDGFAGPSIILLLGFYPIPGLLREPAEMSG